MSVRVLLAVGEPTLTAILKKHLVESGFDVVDQEVFHRNYLQEMIDLEQPSMVVIHDYYLQSDCKDQQEKDREILQMIDYWRLQFDGQLRVVYLCERERSDSFLGALVARNVFDIFYKREIPTQLFIQQLKEPAKYSNVANIEIKELSLESIQNVKKEVSEKKEDPQLEPSSTSSIPKVPTKAKMNESLAKIGFKIHVHKPSKIERVGVAVDRKIVVVVSPFERSGTTFVSHQISYLLAKQGIGVTYFENPFRRPYTYDRFGGHLEVPSYLSLYAPSSEDEREEIERIQEWKVDGVNIQALNPNLEMPYSEEDIPIERFLRMFLTFGETPCLIIDIGADRHRKIYDELLEIASHIFVVVDSDISNLDWFEQNQLSSDFHWIHKILPDERTTLIANRYVKGVEEFLPMEEYYPIPSMNNEWVFRSQFNGTIAFQNREGSKEQEKVFQKLIERITPAALKKSKSFGSWLPKVRVTKE